MIEVDLEVTRAFAELILDDTISDSVKTIRFSALRRISPIMDSYYNEFHNEQLVIAICRKKIEFILNATTKKDINEIMAGPKIRYDGAKIRPANQFCIPEEEMLAWSRTSLAAPLNSVGFERYKELLIELLPEHADIFNSC